jgi:hypothetical protein
MNKRIPTNPEIVNTCSANIQIQKAGAKVTSQDAKPSPLLILAFGGELDDVLQQFQREVWAA